MTDSHQQEELWNKAHNIMHRRLTPKPSNKRTWEAGNSSRDVAAEARLRIPWCNSAKEGRCPASPATQEPSCLKRKSSI